MSTNYKIKIYLLFIAVLLIILTTILFVVQINTNADDRLTVAFLDIGQGDAIFIQTPSKKKILIDGGPSDIVLKRLSDVMPFYDRTIDMIVATHPDADHITGLLYVLKKFNVNYILTTDQSGDTDTSVSLLKSIAREVRSNAQHMIVRRGQEYDFGDGVKLLILFPDRNVKGIDTNDSSIVAKLIYRNTSVLLTGDSPINVEKYLIGLDRKILKSDILKLGHHGSKSSSCNSFLGYTNPKWSIVSAGKNNKYHHPNKDVIARVKSFGIPIRSTIYDGTVVFESDGDNWKTE